MERFRLVLFVMGDAPRSHRARVNLRASLEQLGCANEVSIEEVDLVEQPERGLALGIFATPAVACIAADGSQQILYGDMGTESTLEGVLPGYVTINRN